MLAPEPRHCSSLTANFAWTFLGTLVLAVSNWCILVLLAKLGSVEMVGQFAVGLAVTQPILILAQLQLRGIQATDVGREFRFGHYAALRGLTTALALAAIFAVALCMERDETVIVALVGLAYCVDSLSDVLYGYLQQHECLKRIGQAMLIKGPVSLAFLGAGVYLSGNLIAGVLALFLAKSLVLLAFETPWTLALLRRSSRGPAEFAPGAMARLAMSSRMWNVSVLVRLTLVALPMGIVLMLNSFTVNVPRYRILSCFGRRELGIFAACASMVGIGKVVTGALGQTVTPRLARYYHAGNMRAFRALMARLVALGAGGGIAALVLTVCIGRQTLILLYRPEFAQSMPLLYWLTAAEGCAYIGAFLGVGVTAARSFRSQVPLSLLSVAVASTGSWFLVPHFGLAGAGLSIFLATAAGAAGYFALLRGLVNNACR